MQTKEGYREFLESVAPFCPVPGVPESSLHLHPAALHPKTSLRNAWEEVLSRYHYNFSLIAWPGGIWLARYILDHPDEFAGMKILDVGTGSAPVAIAAARVGGLVTAID